MTRRRDSIGDAPLLAWGEALRRRQQRRSRIRRRLIPLGVGGGLLLLSAVFPPSPRLVWNASASMAVGLYRVSPGARIEPGDLVIAWAPPPYRQLAARRHYLPLDVPLVKRIAAAAGDEVCALGPHIFIDGRPVADRRAVDGAGRPMPLWNGCTRLHGRQLFLLAADPASFDGRYFGISEGGDIVGKATLLWAR